MKTFRKTCMFLLLCGYLTWFLTDSARLRTAATDALSLCARSVIPALFPFLVVSSLLVSLGFGAWAAPLFSGLMTPLFHLPGQAGSALLIGLVAGYPLGARTAVELHQKGYLTRDETERLLCFCNNSNPVFLMNVLGLGVFHDIRIGLWLWLIHIGSALLTGLLCRSKRRSSRESPRPAVSQPAFPSAFVSAVRDSAVGMLFICAFVTLFYTLASPFSVLKFPFGPLLVGCLELFSLTPCLSADAVSFVLAAACSGFGGLSVLCQTTAVLDGTGLSLRPCLLGKLLQGLCSALLAMLLIPRLFL